MDRNQGPEAGGNMNKNESRKHENTKTVSRFRPFVLSCSSFWLKAALLLCLAGCAHQQTRMKSPDENDKDKLAEVKTIRDVASFSNVNPMVASGVGLVTGLEGTGGDPPPGGYRSLVEDQLRTKGVQHIKEVLASRNNAVVKVTALLPAGVHEGDPLDVEVVLAPGSRATSLRGGYLQECFLYEYEATKSLDPNYAGPNRILKGHQIARAEGPLLVGFNDGDEQSRLKQGRLWGGGRSKISRPFYLVLNEQRQFARMAKVVADRINESFHGPETGTLGELAVAKTKAVVYLNVPVQYRHNVSRFMRVVGLIPLGESLEGLQENRLTPSANAKFVSVETAQAYRRRLEEDLLEPKRTVQAALRLEALGAGSIPGLKHGLESAHPLVRFASAEALAYLGDPSCGAELARLAEQQPALRAFVLTAMASLDEAICRVKLRDLLSSHSAETRYGAFWALRTLDEKEMAVQGELLNDSFWLHRIRSDAPPLLHLSTSRRAEILLFGEDIRLVPPFSFLAGEFTITASEEDDHCTIRRLSVSHSTRPQQCPLNMYDVLHALADLGGMYPEAVELIRQAGTYNCLSCPVAVDALPQAVSIYALAKDGGNNPDFLNTDQEILNAREDLGATPTLFEKANGRRPMSSMGNDDRLTSSESQPTDKKKVSGRQSAN
jgi:hypothetical protein